MLSGFMCILPIKILNLKVVCELKSHKLTWTGSCNWWKSNLDSLRLKFHVVMVLKEITNIQFIQCSIFCMCPQSEKQNVYPSSTKICLLWSISCNHLVSISNCSSNWTYQIVHQSFLVRNVMWFIAVRKITQSHSQTKHNHMIRSMSSLTFSTLFPKHRTIIWENWKRVFLDKLKTSFSNFSFSPLCPPIWKRVFLDKLKTSFSNFSLSPLCPPM